MSSQLDSIGSATVRALVTEDGVRYASCHVVRGKIVRDAPVSVIGTRKGSPLNCPEEGSAHLDSLTRRLDRAWTEVPEVAEGFECLIRVAGFDDVQVGDRIISLKS